MNQLFSLFNGNTTSVQGIALEPEKELYQSVPGIPSDESEDPSYTALQRGEAVKEGVLMKT